MTDHKPNTYEDEDMQSVIEQIEKLEDEKTSIKAKAAGECSGIAAKIKTLKKEAKDEQADGIALLPGWRNSSGARAEHALAVALGLEVVELTEAVAA